MPLCDPNLAPLYTNGEGNTTPVFYEHDFYAANGTDLTPLRESPFSVPTTRWSAFLQDEWRVTPRLTVNLGVRYDSESVLRGNGAPAFSLTGQWAPRAGVSWDVVGNGTSKLYASAGRFYYAMPTDLGGSGLHRQHVRRDVQLQPDLHRAGPRHADRSDPAGGILRWRARRPGNQGVLPGRVHDRFREVDRHDSVGRLEGNIPDARPGDRGPVRPRLQHGALWKLVRTRQPGQPRAGLARALRHVRRILQPDRSDGRAVRVARRPDAGREAHLPRRRGPRSQADRPTRSGSRRRTSTRRSRATTPAPSGRAAARPIPGSTRTSTTTSSRTTPTAGSSSTGRARRGSTASTTRPSGCRSDRSSTCARERRTRAAAT